MRCTTVPAREDGRGVRAARGKGSLPKGAAGPPAVRGAYGSVTVPGRHVEAVVIGGNEHTVRDEPDQAQLTVLAGPGVDWARQKARHGEGGPPHARDDRYP